MLLTKKENAVLTITLDRPEIHNAFNDELIEKIITAFKEASSDINTRLIVLTGNGKSFCAGADLNWMKSMAKYSEEENFTDSQKLYSMFEVINDCPKPVLGLINGHALGGGMGLLSVCDYNLTHERAKFGFTETRLGLIPAVISSFCIKKIGSNHARAWFLSGEKFTSEIAKSIGIVHEICLESEFETRSLSLIESFLKAAPEAAIESKRLIFNVQEYPDVKDYTCKAIAKKRISDEGQEGMSALLEKREPRWLKND